MELNNTINQQYLVDKYKTFHSTRKECTCFSIVHRVSTKTDHILGHKTNLNKFKRTEIIKSVFSDHNGIKTRNQ